MNLSLIMPEDFQPVRQQVSANGIQIVLMATQSSSLCSSCQTPSNKVHSFYKRRLADLAISGKPVTLQIHLRKFFCDNSACPRKIFAQSSSTFKPYARRLNRVEQQLQIIALQTGARPSARLCHLIGQPVSYSTLLRISHKTPPLKQSVVKRLGVDDFAFKKGRHYGTILIDLDRHQPIDLLPDRESKTLEDWLRNHPGTESVTRDRSSVYANAITKACPNAVQIADRWHLLANLSQAVERFLDTQRSAINRSLKTSLLTIGSSSAVKPLSEEQLPPFLTWENDLSKLMTMSPTGYTSKRFVMYQKVKQLQAEGHGRRAIALHLGIVRNTVSRYWHQNQFVCRQTPKQSNLSCQPDKKLDTS